MDFITVRLYFQVPVSPCESVTVPETRYVLTDKGPPTVLTWPLLDTCKWMFGEVTVKSVSPLDPLTARRLPKSASEFATVTAAVLGAIWVTEPTVGDPT